MHFILPYQVVPWAVTANVTMVNTAQQFDLRFPKTGGGEDIHYCLEVTGGRLIPVPQVRQCHMILKASAAHDLPIMARGPSNLAYKIAIQQVSVQPMGTQKSVLPQWDQWEPQCLHTVHTAFALC